MEAILSKLILFSFLYSNDLDESVAVVKTAYNKYSDEVSLLNETEALKLLLQYIVLKIRVNSSATLIDYKNGIKKLTSANQSSVNFLTWFEFYKESQNSERLTLLLSQFFKFNDSTVADIIKTEEGSIRYRVSESYQKLSKVIKYA